MHYYGKVTNQATGMPMAGVAVSDGRNVVLTDSEGKYALPGWKQSHTVFVSILTNVHDDWYYFTDGKAGEYNFALTPAEPKEFELLHVSDTEISGDRDVEWVAFMQELCKEKMPAFVMHTGDITRREGILLHKEHMNYDTMGCPVRYVIGNHDYAAGTDTTVKYGEQLYEEEAGPVWNSFDCAGVHCVVLSIGQGCKKDMPSGYTREDQWTWLKNDLEIVGKGKSLVIFEHSPGPDSYTYCMGDMDLKEYGLLAWIYGHAHTNLHHVRSGVHTICTGRAHTGGIDASPAAARRITIADNKLSAQMHYRRFPVAAADKPRWQTKLPGNVLFCEPVLCGESLLAGTACEALPGESGLFCLDIATGKVRWSFAAKGNGIVNNFSVDGEKLYLQDTMGFVYCLNVHTGEKLWEKEIMLGGAGKTNRPTLVAGDLVIVGKAPEKALNKNTGELCWTAPQMRKSGGTYARNVFDSKRDYLLLNSQWGNLLCVKAATGEQVWVHSEKPYWYRNSTPCVDGDVVYSGGFDILAKLDAETGEELLRKDIGVAAKALGAPVIESDGDMNVCGPLTVDGDVLYCPTSTAGVLAVDKNTLEVLRRFPAGAAGILTAPYVKQGAEMVESSPVICGDTLIFTAMDGKVYFYNKNTAELLKTINLPAPSIVKPIVTEDAIYTADFDGNICKFES